MIFEIILSTVDSKGKVNFAPFGIKKSRKFVFISPYFPSKTLTNLRQTRIATANYTNDASFFVKCIVGEKNFQKKKCEKIDGYFLNDCLSHDELVVESFKEDNIRPKFKCRIVKTANHKRFEGFNRAQSSIVEACILATRVKFLKKKKILTDLEFLYSSVEKTAGLKELKLWEKIKKFIFKEMEK